MSLSEPYDVQSPDRLVYGLDAVTAFEFFAERHDIEKALVVTDSDIVAAGVTDPAVNALSRANVSVDVFTGVAPEPKLSMVEAAADELAEGGHELVVGVGGGSSLDTAKFAAALAEHDLPIREMLGMENIPGSRRRLALVPTTAGTGSEVTHIGVFSDSSDGGNKKVIYAEQLFADLAVVDPALTRTLPKPIAAATGLDALTHAVEAYVTVLRTPYSDMLARHAIKLIGENLRQAVHQGSYNDEARYNMSFAATIAGQAFVNSGLGAVHALTYPLGMHYGLGHGEANARLLPHVMEYNRSAEPERFAEIAHLLGYNHIDATSVHDRARTSIDAVVELTEDVGIPTHITDLGKLDQDDFETFADIVFENSEHNIDRNPRTLTPEDVVQIYQNAYNSH